MARITFPDNEEIARLVKYCRSSFERQSYSVQDVVRCLRTYASQIEDLESALDLFQEAIRFDTRGKRHPGTAFIHSVRTRLKDPRSLVAKLARKCEDLEPVTVDDFGSKITDLAGVRLLHLTRSDWEMLHEYLCVYFPKAHAEFAIHEVIAYVRPGEEELFRAKSGPLEFKNGVFNKDSNYTSQHYVFRTSAGVSIECQVRTLLEEAWGEVDHTLRYPFGAIPVVERQLSLLNKAAAVAGDIACSFETISRLPRFISWQSALRLERSADEVLCVSPRMVWAARNVDVLREQLETQGTRYYYYYSRSLGEENANLVMQQLEEHMGSRIFIAPLREFQAQARVPILSDLLLLRNAIDANASAMNCVIYGAPSFDLEKADQYDILITDQETVREVSAFFDWLAERPVPAIT